MDYDQPSEDKIQIWAMSVNNILTPLYVEKSDIEKICDSNWNCSVEENDYTMEHPLDCENIIFKSYARTVYMVSCYNHSGNINFTASRILADQLKFDVQHITRVADGMEKLPRGYVLFIQTLKDQPFLYTAKQIEKDWPNFFRDNMPYDSYVSSNAVQTWDQPLQTLMYIQYKGKKYDTICKYLKEKYDGTLSQKLRCESLLLGCAVYLLYNPINWDDLKHVQINLN